MIGAREKEKLPDAVESHLRDTNPWWEGRPAEPVPVFRRAALGSVKRRLKNGIASIVALRGPRRVGKTTIQDQLISDLLTRDSINPTSVFRVQFDGIPSLEGVVDPILSICRWFQDHILGCTFNEAAQDGRRAYLFFDEVQNLHLWSGQLKALVDHFGVRVLITGSSALRIEPGRDSLAGRIATLDLGTLSLGEIAELRGHGTIPALMPDNGIAELMKVEFWKEAIEHGRTYRKIRDLAFSDFSERGGYPESLVNFDTPWPEMAEYLNETVVRRVLQHDLSFDRTLGPLDHRQLEEVFRLACTYAGQTPGPTTFVKGISQALKTNVDAERALAHLEFLDRSLLLRLVPSLTMRTRSRKGGPKICLCDHALRASWLQEVVPLVPEQLEQNPHLSDIAGHIAESIVGYYLGSIIGLGLDHYPVRGASDPEIDFILTIGAMRIPLEVKYRRTIDTHRDTSGLRAFMKRPIYNAAFGILVTMLDDIEIPDPRIVALPLSSLLLIT